MDAVPGPVQGILYQWRFRTPDDGVAREIASALGLPSLVARILAARRIASVSEAHAFLGRRLRDLPYPEQLPDLDRAVTRIAAALTRGESIAVYGDYDVDGITATAVLVHFLRRLGGRVQWYLPNRLREGYGLNPEALERLHSGGVDLVISVDCGSSDQEAIEFARNLGLDVVITDHHRLSKSLPRASAVVNPRRQTDEAGLYELAGVGVAFYLVSALRAHFRKTGRWTGSGQPDLKDYLELVALGTLADMVPLTAANRILAGAGLQLLSRTTRPGLVALRKICGLEGSQITARDVLFRLGPRLNAPGRLGDAGPALRLLLSTNPGEAGDLAHRLDELNRQRQALEEELLTEIMALLQTEDVSRQNRALVLASPEWHKGLLGLVASRLVESFNKPTILLTRVDHAWEGSGRSFRPYDLFGALQRCRQHLAGFGGHQLAAGLRLQLDQLPEFRTAFEEVLREEELEAGGPRPLKVDALVRLEEITPELMAYMDLMAPFGEGNPEPLFCCRDFRVEHIRVLKGCHLKLVLSQGKARFNAIGFNLTEADQTPSPPEQLLFRPRWNHWLGEKRLELQIVDSL